MCKAVLLQPMLHKAFKTSLISLALVSLLPGIAHADKTDEIVSMGNSRLSEGAKSQKRIDDLSEQTDKIVSKYNQQKKVVDGLIVYNNQLRRTLEAQQVASNKLLTSIEEAALIERQIVPLMIRMISGLERFIEADMPFKKQERTERVARIKGYLTNANISAAERFRQVLEAYSTETDYGKTIAVYPQLLNLDGQEVMVNVLQVGRTALYYQTGDGKQSGYFDKKDRTWKELASSHNEGISDAIRVALKKESPNLMRLPLTAPEEI